MSLIDTHTHLDFPDFDPDRPQLLQRCRAAGVERMVVLGVYQQNWQRLWNLVEHTDGLYAAFGLHPVFLDQHRPEHIDQLRRWLERLHGHPKLCAIGEFGLDYYVESLDRERQQVLFEAQLQLAAEFELPVLLHVRRAHARTLATLKQFRLPRAGIIHAFSGSCEEAKQYRKLSFLLGLGGAGTWPQATRMQRVIATLDDEAIVLETDAPDMAPAMHPGARNSPEFLPEICAELARQRGQTPEQLAAISTSNACRLFGWPLPA